MKGKPRSVRNARQAQLQKAVVNTAEHRHIRWERNRANGSRVLSPAEIERYEAIRNMKMPSHPRPLTKEEYLDKHWR